MTVKEFGKMCRRRGLCSEMLAIKFCDVNGIIEPTEEDGENAYRFAQGIIYRIKSSRHCVNVQTGDEGVFTT